MLSFTESTFNRQSINLSIPLIFHFFQARRIIEDIRPEEVLASLYGRTSNSNPAHPSSLESTWVNYSQETERGNNSTGGTHSPINRSPNRSPSSRMNIPTDPTQDENSRFDPPSYDEQTPEAPPPSYQEVMRGGYTLK